MRKAIVTFALYAAMFATGATAEGYKKIYFGATRPGSWAHYTMHTEGQPDMDYRSTRLPDDGGRQRVENRVQYTMQGKLTTSYTVFVLKPGYLLENDALGFGKALVGMKMGFEGQKATDMAPAMVENARRTMPDYAASAQFVGTENIGGKSSDHYTYVNRYPGNPATVETGELWLDDSVPFGMVRQKAITKETSGKVVSQFEMLLIDSGAGATSAQITAASPGASKAPSGAGPVAATLVDAYRKGQVKLLVTVLPGGDGRNVRIAFTNQTDRPLRLGIPAGPIAIDADSPVNKFALSSAATKSIDLKPGDTSDPVEFTQSGTRRPIDGRFTLSVYEGTPLYSGSVTMGTVK